MSVRRSRSRTRAPAQERAEHKSVVPYTMYNRVTMVAPRLRTWLKYCSYQTLTTTAVTGFGIQAWNLNSLFDPDAAVGGHQPRGFDQLAALYNRYRVYRVRWQIDVAHSTGLTTNSAALLATLPTNGTTPGDFNSVVENTFSTVKPFNPATVCTIRGAIDLPKLNGKTPQAYMSDDTTGALVTSSPTEVILLNVAILATQGTAEDFAMHTSLWFDSEFSDYKNPAQS